MLQHVQGLPSVALPQAVGLHANAAIAKDRHEAATMLDSLQRMQGQQGSSAAAKSRDEELHSLISDITARIVQPFDIEAAR